MKELTEEEKKNFLEWSEGNKYLYELLCACWKNEIPTHASCGGHEEGVGEPYLSIIINDNSIPFIESILGQIQDMQNIEVFTNVRHSGNGQLYDDEVLRSIKFSAQKYNCCEMFYKMKKGIECKTKKEKLTSKVEKFLDRVKKLKETSIEELQEDVNNNIGIGSTFSTKTQEFIDYENGKKMVRNSKLIRFFRKLLPFKKVDNTQYEQLQQKYGFLQREYSGERTTRIEYTRGKLHEKGINLETQDYVIQYIDVNQKLFGKFLDIDKVIDRIVGNLNYGVKTFSGISNIAKKDGSWNAYEHTIYINPLKKGKRIKPIIMHELDHCATTTYRDMGDEEKERYIAKRLNNSGSLLKEKKLEQYFNKHLKGSNGKFPFVGIRDDRQLDYLSGLNEGITEYKVEKYCELLGIKPQGCYIIEKMVAQFIADTIGEEKLISMHFNNDYEGIRKAFKLETGKDLNKLVHSMNFIRFNMSLSSVPLFVAKREMIEQFNNYKFEAKHEEGKGSTGITEKHLGQLHLDDLGQAYGDTAINYEDVKRAYETIEQTKAEREQSPNKGRENNLEGR